MDEEYFCEHCQFAGFSQASLKTHTRTEKHKYLSKIADLQDSLDEAIWRYNDLYDAHEELKDEYKKKNCGNNEEIILTPQSEP